MSTSPAQFLAYTGSQLIIHDDCDNMVYYYYIELIRITKKSGRIVTEVLCFEYLEEKRIKWLNVLLIISGDRTKRDRFQPTIQKSFLVYKLSELLFINSSKVNISIHWGYERVDPYASG